MSRRLSPYLSILCLLVVNFYIARDLFHVEYTVQMGSPEGSFMAIARGWLEHPFDMLWWPFSDAGMPVQNTYFPLVPAATAMLAKLFGLSAALALHVLAGLAYCLGPVALFWMAWKIGGSEVASLGAALAYSLFSPSVMFHRVVVDMNYDLQGARRFQNLLFYGEVPHVLALTLLPVAILFLYFVFEGRRNFAVPAGIAAAFVAIANAFGAVTLGIAALCLLSTMERDGWRNLARAAVIGILAALWILPLIPPWEIATIVRNTSATGSLWRSLAAIAALLLAAAAYRKLGFRLRWPLALRFSLLLAIVLGAIIWCSTQFGLEVIPQPHRLHPDFEMAACIAAAFGLREALRKTSHATMAAVAAVLIVAAGIQVVHYRRFAKRLDEPVDIARTTEYQTAQWLATNLPGARVMAAGSIALWLNAFVDNPQLAVGHEATTPNYMRRVAVFTIYSGLNAGARDGEVSVKWLKVFGAQAVVVPGPASREVYHPFTNPNKFEGLLPVMQREEGNTIYSVPQRSKSLVYAIPRTAVIRTPPVHGLDTAPLEPYLAALDDASLPVPQVTWTTRHSAVIRANLAADQVLSVQMNYHPGWHTSKGQVSPDAAGLMVVDPGCQGDCEVRLEYDGGLEFRLTLLASLLAMAAGVTFGLRARL